MEDKELDEIDAMVQEGLSDEEILLQMSDMATTH